MADPITTLPDGTPLTDQFKVPLTASATDQHGSPIADTVTWTADSASASLADATDTTVTVVPGDLDAGVAFTFNVTATDPGGLTAVQAITFTGTFSAAPTALTIAAGAPVAK
jgi:hypothetical protein